jgi:crotonobetainyl-CoA:carnitine CoA-transferase CaiB-like acyl-CoA transferase
VFDNEQVQARGMVVDMPHRRAGRMRTVANPLRLSETPVRYRRAPPTLGEHTSAVLQELLGLTEAEIGRLSEDGAI